MTKILATITAALLFGVASCGPNGTFSDYQIVGSFKDPKSGAEAGVKNGKFFGGVPIETADGKKGYIGIKPAK